MQKIEILAVGIGCTGELSLSVGCEPSLRDDELFASKNLHRKNRKGACYEKEYKKYFDKHILTKSILLSGLVTCEEQINKYAYMEKKWKNRYESNDPVYYESYKACRLEWMGMREKIQAVLQKNQYLMSQIVQLVKGEEYRLPQKDVRAIVDLIDSGTYEYRE